MYALPFCIQLRLTYRLMHGSSLTPSQLLHSCMLCLQLPNDPNNPIASNLRGTLAFGAEYTEEQMAVNRSTELYLNLGDNSRLDAHGFTPVGWVIDQGMEKTVDAIYDGYGEMSDLRGYTVSLATPAGAGIGMVTLKQSGSTAITLSYSIGGLAPRSVHGFHIHAEPVNALGDCLRQVQQCNTWIDSTRLDATSYSCCSHLFALNKRPCR